MRGCKQRIHSWHVSHSWCFDGNGWVRRTHVSTKHRQTNHESWQTSAKNEDEFTKGVSSRERERRNPRPSRVDQGRTDGRTTRCASGEPRGLEASVPNHAWAHATMEAFPNTRESVSTFDSLVRGVHEPKTCGASQLSDKTKFREYGGWTRDAFSSAK